MKTAEDLLRDEGKRIAAERRADELNTAQGIAKIMAIRNGVVTADDVQEQLIVLDIHLGNAAGSIFRGKDWDCLGFVKSRRVGNHSRFIRKWRLVSMPHQGSLDV